MKSFIDSNYILIIKEMDKHPNSIVPKIKDCFETINIVYVNQTTQLTNYKAKPLFDKKYLFIIEDYYTFEQIYKSLNLKLVFPIFLLRRSSDEMLLKNLLHNANIPYYIYNNQFTKEDAIHLILCSASSDDINDDIIKKILSKTGLNPRRILEATMLLNSVGYTASNISKHLDRNIFVSNMDILDVLLHYPKMSKSKYKAVLNYLMTYRNSYLSYIKKELLKEMELYITVYSDILNGIVSEKGVTEYIAGISSLNSYKYMHILELFELKSINQLKVVEHFIKHSSFLQFVNAL